MKSLRTACIARHLPLSALTVAAGIAALAHANPAHALGGGVKLTQTGGVTTVQINGAVTTFKPPTGNLSGFTNGPYNLEFQVAGSPQATSWQDLGGGLYVYNFQAISTIPYNTTLYPSLSGTVLSGTYQQGFTNTSFLRVFSNGNLKFSIASDINDPPDCFTGLVISGATGSDCDPYLNVLDLDLQTGKTGNVPNSAPGTLPTVAVLLEKFTGTYNGVGNFSSGGSETRVQFSSTKPVPSPLPVLGASMAFGFSRRLRQRIAQHKPSARS